ncbi:MAG: hypothetical protein HC919_09210 [Oscillatoriales cyanobacterium SM2_2_1]|nr:hypothetical protein [Oscillatoriales cyanobacterium SM2_2_1]
MSAPQSAKSNITLNATLPSVRHVHALIRTQAPVEVKLVTGDQLRGRLLWIDDHCVCVEESGSKVVLWKQAIAYIR